MSRKASGKQDLMQDFSCPWLERRHETLRVIEYPKQYCSPDYHSEQPGSANSDLLLS